MYFTTEVTTTANIPQTDVRPKRCKVKLTRKILAAIREMLEAGSSEGAIKGWTSRRKGKSWDLGRKRRNRLLKSARVFSRNPEVRAMKLLYGKPAIMAKYVPRAKSGERRLKSKFKPSWNRPEEKPEDFGFKRG